MMKSIFIYNVRNIYKVKCRIKKIKKKLCKLFLLSKKVFRFAYHLKQTKTSIMKKSDVLIIAVGIVIIVALFAAITYVAFTVNAANAGLHGGF
jgi:hypothetical protein